MIRPGSNFLNSALNLACTECKLTMHVTEADGTWKELWVSFNAEEITTLIEMLTEHRRMMRSKTLVLQ